MAQNSAVSLLALLEYVPSYCCVYGKGLGLLLYFAVKSFRYAFAGVASSSVSCPPRGPALDAMKRVVRDSEPTYMAAISPLVISFPGQFVEAVRDAEVWLWRVLFGGSYGFFFVFSIRIFIAVICILNEQD
jgi:hypothetical protein